MAHKVYGTTIESSIHLPELLPVEQEQPEYVFELLSAKKQELTSVPWFHHWGPTDEEVWLYFGKQGDRYLLRFPDLADFFVSQTGESVKCVPVPEVPMETIRHLLVDQVFPLALSQRGQLVLHASAVACEKGAIAFAGESGAGKSTLAASFAKDRFPFITDDCLVFGQNDKQLIVLPGYPGVRLWQDVVDSLFDNESLAGEVAHYTSKKRIDLANPAFLTQDDPVTLRRIYFLQPYEPFETSRSISITSISPRESFLKLVGHAYKLGIDDRNLLVAEFQYLSRIVTLPIFYQLRYPQEISFLPAVKEAILENLSS